jgi:hypothetical protein
VDLLRVAEHGDFRLGRSDEELKGSRIRNIAFHRFDIGLSQTSFVRLNPKALLGM